MLIRRGCAALLLATVLALALAACSGTDQEQGQDEPLSLGDAVSQMLLIGFRGTELDSDIAPALQEISPGGVILFDYDVPSHQEMGQSLPNDTKEVAAELAAELRSLGINWNLAPVVDVNLNTESPAIGALERSFSVDPGLVAAHAEAFVAAHTEARVVPTLKHFPGHGSAAGDTHLGVTDVTSTSDPPVELLPYEYLIDGGYPGTIMTAHIVNRKLDPTSAPATLSHDIVTDLLRDRLGFDGVVVSDDMQMGAIVEEYELEPAAVAAVKAGVDVILVAGQASYDLDEVRRIKQAILQAVSAGEISEDRIYQSADRILTLKRAYGIIN